LGLLAWLVARRGGPALRGTILLATLVALLVAPALAAFTPTWMTLPEWLCPPEAGPERADFKDDRSLPGSAPAATSPVFALLLEQPSAETKTSAVALPNQARDATLPQAKTEAVVATLTPLLNDVAPAARSGAVPPMRAPSSLLLSLVSVLAIVWLIGTLVFLARAIAGLTLLYRCASRARPIREDEWTICMQALAQRYALPVVALREGPAVASPLTLGLLRPVILLPLSRRGWKARERDFILGHELAHVGRHDFRAGLLAELTACLFWLHPLVRWLVVRLRLEQEYAADAWVASAVGDSGTYVRCLARLALERSQRQPSLAITFWRRRPEILRRIDMLRRNPNGLPPRVGKWTAWTVAALTVAACVAVAGVGRLQSAPEGLKPAKTNPDAETRTTTVVTGDPLPANALARLGTTRLRHGADVTFVAFGPDGKSLLTAGQDNTIRLWNFSDGKEIRRFTRPRPIPLQRPQKGDKVEKAPAKAGVMMLMSAAVGEAGGFRVALTQDGKTLAGAGDNVIQLWDVTTGKELRQIERPAPGLAGLLFSPDGRTLAGRTVDGALFLWSADTGKEIRHIKPARRQADDGIVLVFGGDADADAPGMVFSPDGKVLAAAATDYKQQEAIHSVKLWDLASGKELRKISAPGGVRVSTVAMAPGGMLLAYGGGNIVHLCETETGKEVRQIKTGGGIAALSFLRDSKMLVVRGRNHQIQLWETATGKAVQTLSEAEPPRQTGGLVFIANDFSAPETRTLAISPDGQRIAAAAGSTVRLWDAATGKEMPLLDGHRRAPTAIILSHDGKTVVSWGSDRVIRRWEAATGKQVAAFPAPTRTTLAAFSADGQTIGLANADNTIRLHDTVTGRELRRLSGFTNGIAGLAFAPGGKVLAVRGRADSIIRLYDVAGGVELRQIFLRPRNNSGQGRVLIIGGGGSGSSGTGPGLAFSPDGRLIVASLSSDGESGNTLFVFDTTTGKELRKIESAKAISSFAFSPDGRSIAAENSNRTITLWEVASGKERGRLGKPVAEQPQRNAGAMMINVVVNGFPGGFTEPSGPVSVAFSPDGRALVTQGPDRSVSTWDVAAGKELGRLQGHEGRINTIAFAPNGKSVASGASDTTILLWDATGLTERLEKPAVVELSAMELESLWGDLAGEDATKACQDLHRLAGAALQTVAFLRERLQPAIRVDPAKLARWIADLEDKKFAVRQEAVTELVKVGEQALPVLRELLQSKPQLETRRRCEELIDRLTSGAMTPAQLRVVRAVEALEQIGTPEARQVLRTLAVGAPGALPTREAQAALGRLASK
ncbi:MAG TPA: M56 family metallopeptidase, partial [Gemmataceae bacterium]|nr:M56 family metallopeptidase [Gemmataceae bacterium]